MFGFGAIVGLLVGIAGTLIVLSELARRQP